VPYNHSQQVSSIIFRKSKDRHYNDKNTTEKRTNNDITQKSKDWTTDRHYNDKNTKEKRTNNDITQKSKDWATWTPLNAGGQLRCSGRVNSGAPEESNQVLRKSQLRCSGRVNSGAPEEWTVSAPLIELRVTLVTNPVISHEWWEERVVITRDRTYMYPL